MRGKYNNKTKRYEYSTGNPVERINIDGYTREEQEELHQIEKVKAEGGTYLERYAKELGVEQADLLKNILASNTMQRFNSVRNYTEFKMLRQTLVEEKGAMGEMKEWNNAIADSMGYTKYNY